MYADFTVVMSILTKQTKPKKKIKINILIGNSNKYKFMFEL